MATIEKRVSKKGKISYRITLAGGVDSAGKQIRIRRTWEPPKPDMTPKQIEKALNRAVADFEREVEQGYRLDINQTFSEYAAYVIDLKERAGVKPKTIDRYTSLLERVDRAIGHLKLTKIHPQHINAFYKNLSEIGIRQEAPKANVKIDLAAVLKKHNISISRLARHVSLSASTVSAAVRGKTVNYDTAVAIAAALDENVENIFDIKRENLFLSNETILSYHRFISTVLSQAEKEMLIPFNPASKATPPKREQKTPDYYQPEDIAEILSALSNEPLKWKALTYLLLDTGCRRGEAVGLKWDSVDLNTGLITIERALLYTPQRGVYEGTTKTGKTRTLRLAQETLTLLKEHYEEQLRFKEAYKDTWVETGYVFTRDNGDRMHPDSITSWLNKFSRKYNLRHIHPHAFRHTAASTMIANGVDLITAANELGHSDATTTAAIYAHQINEAKARAEKVRASIFRYKK